jgi:PAS domain-containing protein
MDANAWVRELPAAITVCDENGIILEFNDRARDTFASDGGEALIGTNVLECHPEPARTTLREMLASGKRNVYTIQKAGIRKLIYQTPWYHNGIYAGFVELSLPIPETLPHFDRDEPISARP